MLYKNDEPYKLAPNDIATITKKFHDKWPLLVIYPPERIKPPQSKQNRQKDKPNSIAFPLTAIVKTDTGTEVWRYADNVILKEHGVKKYTPRHLRYNGRLALSRQDIELAWFLYTKSPYCKGGMNQGRLVKFMFEDKITEAEIEARKAQIRTRVSALVHDPDLGIPEAKLRVIAKALFIKNVDDLTYAQVKLQVEHHVLKGKEEGFEEFSKMIDMNELVKTRVAIQKVIDAGFLKYEAPKKTWTWYEDEAKPKMLCRVAPQSTATETIYDYYMGNKEFQEIVELAGKPRGRKGSDKGKDPAGNQAGDQAGD